MKKPLTILTITIKFARRAIKQRTFKKSLYLFDARKPFLNSHMCTQDNIRIT